MHVWWLKPSVRTRSAKSWWLQRASQFKIRESAHRKNASKQTRSTANTTIKILTLSVFTTCGWRLESSKTHSVKTNCANGVSKISSTIYVCVSGRTLLANLKSLSLSWALAFQSKKPTIRLFTKPSPAACCLTWALKIKSASIWARVIRAFLFSRVQGYQSLSQNG